MKLVIAGGSSVNTPAFVAALRGSSWRPGHLTLLGRSPERLEAVAGYVRAAAAGAGIELDVTAETDPAAACEGAGVVLSTVRAGGLERLQENLRNLAGSGVTGHAASYVEAIDNLPAVLGLARTVEQVAPGALFANFTNPVSLVNEAVAVHTGIRAVGLCHHAFSMPGDFARLLRVDASTVSVRYLGLNHLGWVTDVLVEGSSRMTELVDVLRRERVGKYNYWYATPSLVPVDHAFCFYRRGEVWLNRQKGIRGSLSDATLLLHRTAPWIRNERRHRARLLDALRTRDVAALDLFAREAPWYDTCIVPFLEAFASKEPRELLLTWRHGPEPSLPGETGETAVLVGDGGISAVEGDGRLPAYAVELLRQARASERMFADAIVAGSAERAAEAWLVHPNVASKKHADRLAARYFGGRGSALV